MLPVSVDPPNQPVTATLHSDLDQVGGMQMNGTALQRCAAERALQLPGADLSHPFGEEWDVYKVRGKVFMLQTVLHGSEMVTLKARPGDSRALREAFSEISPGYHMNKRHWITITPGGDIEQGMVEDLVTESYLLVIESNVPKYQWPVNPATFGLRSGDTHLQ